MQRIANGPSAYGATRARRVEVPVPSDLIPAIIAGDSAFFMLDLPARIDSVLPNSAGESAEKH